MLFYLKVRVYKHIQMKCNLFILAISVIVIHFHTYINHNI
jgi:hypothetical protein